MTRISTNIRNFGRKRIGLPIQLCEDFIFVYECLQAGCRLCSHSAALPSLQFFLALFLASVSLIAPLISLVASMQFLCTFWAPPTNTPNNMGLELHNQTIITIFQHCQSNPLR